MYFAEDMEHGFYYYGNVEPYKGIFKDLVMDYTPKLIAVDTETISLKERIPIGIGIALSPHIAFYFKLFPTVSPVVPLNLIKDTTITKIYHNSLFDLSALREYEPDMSNIVDTNIISRLLCFRFNDLVGLSPTHLMEVHDAKEVMQEHNADTMLDVPTEVVAKKCMQDCSATYMVYNKLHQQVDANYLAVEMAIIPICINMSNRGLKLDQTKRKQIELELTDWANYYRNICDEVGFNPGSNQQVSYMLAKRGAYNVFHKLPFTNRKRTMLSTAEETLKKMNDPLATVVLQYREYAKLLSTYIEPWSHSDRAYTLFHLDAITGRPSSTGAHTGIEYRNMQNVPGKFRKDGSAYPVNCRACFEPDSGMWTDVDWEQLEPKCLAYLSGDHEMARIFAQPKRNPDGSRNPEGDIHLQVAMFMNIERKLGKTINLAMTYGATDETLMEQSGIMNKSRVATLRYQWGNKFPEAMAWIESRQEDALRTGIAKTVFGRSIRLPTLDEDSVDSIRRKAIDYPCQGSAAEILKRGLIRLKDLDLALQVHDELLADGYAPEDRFKVLEDIAPFRTTVEVRYLDRWE